MSEKTNLRAIRLKKLQKIKEAKINPYPSKTERTCTCAYASLNYEKLKDKEITLCGRIRLIRVHGRSTFVDIHDDSGTIQLYLQQDILGEDKYKFFDNFDLGDFIQARGTLFTTKVGEKTVRVSDYKMLAKALRPLPEKWHGLKDIELRFRKRYLDLATNSKTRQLFRKRTLLIQKIRQFLDKKGFLEVQTPILQTICGGAAAKPFTTHHDALHLDLYLRIAPELYLKRLIVGGYEKIYEIGAIFRNEGMSPQHLQEITELEYYWAYKNFEDLMEFNEDLFSYILSETYGTLKFEYQGKKIDFTPPWPKRDFRELVLTDSGLDIKKLKSRQALASAMEKIGLVVDPAWSYAKLLDELYKEVSRRRIVQPIYLINHPLALSPLAKKPSPEADIVERFQIVVSGFEIGNGYSELNDPIEQKERFEEQARLRAQGEIEAHCMDTDFVEALEYGMPPVAGFGLGIDRLITILSNSETIREVVFFPLMKPKISSDVATCNMESKTQKSFDSGASYSMVNNAGIERNKALELVKKELANPNLIKHALAVEVVMAALAKKLKQNENVWRICGLLHDLDYEKTLKIPKKHGLVAAKMLEKIGVAKEIIHAICAHNEATGIRPESQMAWALYAADPLTGLIVACALVMPNKKIANVKVDTVLKKFKEKNFAAGVSRESIKKCQKLGITLKEFIEIGLSAMQSIHKELGL